jgi:hypothetical protein
MARSLAKRSEKRLPTPDSCVVAQMKMRVTLKLNNACAARNAVAGKAIRQAAFKFVDGGLSPGCAGSRERPPSHARLRARLRLARICNCFSDGRKNGS